jgi:hypothetical protein
MSIKLHCASLTCSVLVIGCGRSLYPLPTMEWETTLLSIVSPDLIASGDTIAVQQADRLPVGLLRLQADGHVAVLA